MFNPRIKVNLQLFAESSEPAGAASPAPASPEPAPSTPEPSGNVDSTSNFASLAEKMFNNMNSNGGVETPAQVTNEETPAQQVPPAPQQPTPAQPDILKALKDAGLTKFLNDPESLIKSYKSLEAHSSRLAQENKRVKGDFEALNQQIQQQQPAAQPETSPDPNVNPLDALYENPEKFIMDKVNAIVQERLAAAQEPIMKNMQVLTEKHREQIRDTTVNQFMNDHPETATFITDIANMIADDQEFNNLSSPEEVSDRLDSYLTIAKGKSWREPPSADKVLQDALANEDMLSKYVLGNEAIRNRILTETMNAAKKVPPVITTQGGSILTPPDAKKPGTFEELGDGFKKMFGL